MKLLYYTFIIISSLSIIPASAQSDMYSRMLSHVEKITVVDTLTVDKGNFFQNYRLQPSAGFILSAQEVAEQLRGTAFPSEFEGRPFTGFTNEFNDYIIWAQEDSTGYLRLAESYRLLDGSWSTPEFTSEILNFGEEPEMNEEDGEKIVVDANAVFPFMLDDGQTLYFASDNDFSLGGYDIFVATKDPSDGEFLIPGNIGLPFNSPYDDYMMAYDPQTGVGWWASDRNQLGDKLTIYIYALTEDRTDVEPDDENLPTYASLSGWESLLTDEQREESARLKQEIANIKLRDNRIPDFSLPMPGGKTYHFYTDFKNRNTVPLMQKYLRDAAFLKDKELELVDLRLQYSRSRANESIKTKIKNLEQQVRLQRTQLKSLLSQVYQSEAK